MRLRLEFPDKYRLWSELVKANTDRVFIETTKEATPKLGSRVPVELAVGGVLLMALADVVALRNEGGRFKPGVWVKLDDDEVLKVRRFLGLAEEPSRPATGRKSHREPCALVAKLRRPDAPNATRVRNLSESGALLQSEGGPRLQVLRHPLLHLQ